MAGGNCPETPRQKMIGMMYLFYTALLALNVSNEVIEAFVKIDKSINQTTANFSAKTSQLYNTIAAKVKDQPGKYEALDKQAQEINKQTTFLFNYIDSLKAAIIIQAGEKFCDIANKEAGIDYAAIKDGDKFIIDAENIGKKDNLEASHVVMGAESGQFNQGERLRLLVNQYREKVLSKDIVKDTAESVYKGIKTSLETYEGARPVKEGSDEIRTWAEKYYQAMPMIGTIALLSKLQADVRNVEADILEYMIKDLEGLDIRITALEGLISTSTSFVVRGGKYESKIFLGALDTTMRPTIHVTSSYPFYDSILEEGEVKYKLRTGVAYDTLPVDASGKGKLTRDCGSIGDFKYGGLIHYKSNKGDKWLPFMGQYQVGETGVTVSASKCNVFYRGLQNPVSVAVAGYPKENVSVSITAGSIVRSGNEYIVEIPTSVTQKEVSVHVSVKTEGGSKSLGSTVFKVFDVPPPTINVAGTYKDGSTMPKAAITSNAYLTASLGGGFFPFDGVKYSVASFDFLYSVRGVEKMAHCNGAQVSSEALEQIKLMGQGARLSFTNIRYTGPSGTKTTNGVTVIIK